jgi:hypothetical protein
VTEVVEIMEGLANALGDQEIALGNGDLFFVMDHKSDSPPPEHPEAYDFTVVTPRLIALTYGSIHKGGHRSERLKVFARKNISQVTVTKTPGEVDEYGHIARAHEVSISFSNGNSMGLPLLDEDLTVEGADHLARLIPSLYQDLAA